MAEATTRYRFRAELSVPDPRRLLASLRKLGGPRAESFTPNDVAPLLVTGQRIARAPVLGVIGKRGIDALFEVALSGPACAAILERFGSP